jgi:type III secretory pathway component EscU
MYCVLGPHVSRWIGCSAAILDSSVFDWAGETYMNMNLRLNMASEDEVRNEIKWRRGID